MAQPPPLAQLAGRHVHLGVAAIDTGEQEVRGGEIFAVGGQPVLPAQPVILQHGEGGPALHAGWLGPVGRVPDQPAPSHGVVEGVVEDGVDPADGGGCQVLAELGVEPVEPLGGDVGEAAVLVGGEVGAPVGGVAASGGGCPALVAVVPPSVEQGAEAGLGASVGAAVELAEQLRQRLVGLLGGASEGAGDAPPLTGDGVEAGAGEELPCVSALALVAPAHGADGRHGGETAAEKWQQDWQH